MRGEGCHHAGGQGGLRKKSVRHESQMRSCRPSHGAGDWILHLARRQRASEVSVGKCRQRLAMVDYLSAQGFVAKGREDAGQATS